MAFNFLNRLFIFAVLFLFPSTAELVQFYECNDNSSINDSICEITEVRVEPCRAPAEDNEPCIFKRHETVKIEFDFIAHFNASTLGHQAYSVSIVDLPMPNMDSGDACEYTDCPVKAERKQTYKFQVEMLPFFPLLRYTLKWRLWNRDLEDDVQDCCFLMQIKLIR